MSEAGVLDRTAGTLDRAVELDLFGWPRTPPPPVPWGEATLIAAALLVLIEWAWLLSRWF